MNTKRIEGSVALVTGANRGIGKAVVEELLERGAGKVYATARQPESLADLVDRYGGRVVPLALDVTDADQIRDAARVACDVSLLVNNAGVAFGGWLGDGALEQNARHEMEVSYFGPLLLLESFAPILLAQDTGVVINLSSVAGLTNFPLLPTYSAAKAALHSLTQAARLLLGPQGITVSGVYPGPVDTDLAKDIPLDKASTKDVAVAIVDGIEAGEEDIFTDAFAQGFAELFQASPKASEQSFAAMLAGAS